jgi:hypothetical protein
MEQRTRLRWGTYLLLLVLSMVYLQVLSLSTVSILQGVRLDESMAIKYLKRKSTKPTAREVSAFAQSRGGSVQLFSSQYDAEDYVEHVEDDVKDSFMASPLSQLRSDEVEALYRGPFSRHEQWLEQATEEVLNLEIGSLREDDAESITGLMAAWVRRRSVNAALEVEKLLKRVVDDMRAHNPEVYVTNRMYTIVSSWLSF